jgi:HSP20 family protein
MLPVLRRGSWLTPTFDDTFSRLRNEVDTLYDRFFGGDGGSLVSTWSGVPIAMWEDDDHVTIEAELPGLTEKDFELTVHNGMLYLQGERRAEEGRRYLFNGRGYGRFERVIALPTTVNPDDVKAKLVAGVLHLELSKTAEARPKKIAVKEG